MCYISKRKDTVSFARINNPWRLLRPRNKAAAMKGKEQKKPKLEEQTQEHSTDLCDPDSIEKDTIAKAEP